MLFLDREVPMENIRIMNETFSIQFAGKAFDNHEIPASALAQSLLALDGLAKRTAEVVYGKDANAEINSSSLANVDTQNLLRRFLDLRKPPQSVDTQ